MGSFRIKILLAIATASFCTPLLWSFSSLADLNYFQASNYIAPDPVTGEVSSVTNELGAADIVIEELPSTFTADAPGSGPDALGMNVLGVQDMTGDGISDLLVSNVNPNYPIVPGYSGTPLSLTGGSHSVFLFSGSTLASGAGSPIQTNQAHFTLTSYFQAGHVLAEMPDIDNDGKPELVLGYPMEQYANLYPDAIASTFSFNYTQQGLTLVVLSSQLGAPNSTFQTSNASRRFFGQSINSKSGSSVAAANFIGSGVSLAIGAPGFKLTSANTSTTNHGKVYIFNQINSLSTQNVNVNSANLSLYSPTANARLGTSMVTINDFSGDGLPELAISAPTLANPSPYSGSTGRVYILKSQTLQSLLQGPQVTINIQRISDIIITNSPGGGTLFGNSLSQGDFDGDGLGDLLITKSANPKVLYFSGSVLANIGQGTTIAANQATTSGSVPPGYGLKLFTFPAGIDGKPYDRFVSIGTEAVNTFFISEELNAFDPINNSYVFSIPQIPDAPELADANVTGLGDINGDGFNEFVIGIPRYSDELAPPGGAPGAEFFA